MFDKIYRMGYWQGRETTAFKCPFRMSENKSLFWRGVHDGVFDRIGYL